MKFLKDSIITISAKGIHFVVLFALSVITARYLGPEGKGTLSLALLAPTVLLTLGELGVSGANVYMIGRKKYQPDQIWGNSFVLALVLSGSLFIIFWATSPWHYHIFKGIDRHLLIIAVAALPFSFITPYSFVIFLAVSRIARYSLSKLLEDIFFLVFIFIFLILLRRTVIYAVLAFTLSHVFAAFGVLWLLRSLYNIRITVNPVLLKETLSYGVKRHLGEIGGFLNRRLDVFLVNYFCGLEQVGLYTVGVSLGELLWYLPSSLSSLLFSRTAQTDKQAADDFTPVFMRTILFILVIGAVLLLVLSRLFVRLAYGDTFLPSVIPLWILLPGIIMYAISRITDADLSGRGKPIVITIASGVSLVLNVGLNLLFIPRWGIAGAAFASTISYSVSGLIPLFVFLKISGNSIRTSLIITKADIVNLVGIVNSLIRRKA